ncbi:hypothetical protein CPB83DRAFT_809745 [Crepidotus variabilis]|uniref:NAD(P)-binding domain-containing protein n=1 Tax=Crepidotus variabilis TaxID=179855 RepID=A0A9P6EJI7_9AGAR|nr:hypothetical protein CPB83DRAFT_809745 [Crepidotus variabilis]
MSSKTKVLFTGATGYIGGTVLKHFLNYTEFSSYEITALIRSSEKAANLEKLGIRATVGSYNDATFTESLSAEADIVISAADADNVPAIRAILAGLKKRHTATGILPVIIHTSGTGVVGDNAAGDRASDFVYDDTKVEELDALSDTAIHRPVDLTLINADKEGYVKSYIILPSAVYGSASGILLDKGIQKPHSSDLIAYLGNAAVARGQSGVVGEGKNIWPNIHVEDNAELYIAVLDAIRKGADIGHGREGYYFAENGEHSFYEVARAIGEVLVSLGISSNPEPTTFTREELSKYLGVDIATEGSSLFGINARCRGTRGRAIGWKPRYNKADFLACVKPDIEGLVTRLRG